MQFDPSTPQNKFWDSVALTKEFKDPFYISELLNFLNTDSHIIEYGCGYGRLLNILAQNNFNNIQGFDFSKAMIERGKRQFPHLNLQQIEHATIPLASQSTDAAILSTVLCCVPNHASQVEIINEISRILKPNGVIYLTDFLISDTQNMIKKYESGFKQYQEWGVYQTTEGAIVKHYSAQQISSLMNQFTVGWYHEEEFVTMNNNVVKTFHGIYKKCN